MRQDHKVIILAITAALVVADVARSTAGEPAPPNIVFILVDDVGREVLGCYGGQSYATPEIDRLAGSGARFEHAYAMPTCHPTRITLLTGQYPFRLGHPVWGSFPRKGEPHTLANVLKQADYATCAVGKWQLALLGDDLDQPHRMGFDEYCLLGWHEGPWYYQPFVWQNGRRRMDVSDGFGPDVITDYAIDFMTRHKDERFFLWYATTLCHAETNDLERPAPVGPQGRYDSFAEMTAKMDRDVGRLVAAVTELGLREETLIIFLADNGTARRNLIDARDGEYIYEDIVSKVGGRSIPGGKATLTDWGCRVPLILNWPGKIEPGQVSSNLVDASDFLPSLAPLAGAELSAGVRLDGRATLLQTGGQAAAERRWVFAEHDGHAYVRDPRWKLYDDGRFIDMQSDPDEQQPLDADNLTTVGATVRRELQTALRGLGYKP